MKKILLSVLVGLAFVTANAQAQSSPFTLGIKGGVSSTKVMFNDVQGTSEYRNPENITGYHAGAFARLQIAGFFVQPEALLASSGGKIQVFDNQVTTPTGSTQEFRFTRLDVPIMVGYNLFNFLRVQAGPVASIMMSAKQEGKTIDDYMNESDWGIQGGVGIDISRLTLDLRYETIKRQYTESLNRYDMRNQQFIVSVGYKLL
ncbi:PorT family protein [Pontibacter qinzhouensis]|uniref:PorT family protein n=1 Tax=Pontibacter qinzhouensis TaxID=2603253 RepID=A0A5C8J8N4_9BACT|nr:porin family protein [Pontibacter qinzhouensis]TXK33819.1 PorT family protein [Pontibacter qinzhouensis]